MSSLHCALVVLCVIVFIEMFLLLNGGYFLPLRWRLESQEMLQFPWNDEDINSDDYIWNTLREDGEEEDDDETFEKIHKRTPSLNVTDVKPPKIVLLWTNLYESRNHWHQWYFRHSLKHYGCKEYRCNFTTDRRLLKRSAAVVFHIWPKDFNREPLPQIRFPHQRWVFFARESPTRAPKLKNLHGVFNWTVTYRWDSDIMAPYWGSHHYSVRPSTSTDWGTNKTRLVAWFVSRCKTHGARENFVRELQKYIPIDIYGKCGPFKCPKNEAKYCYKNILEKKYKFYLSFENSICKDYVTEKFIKILGRRIVPVVFGGANYSRLAPPGSYIDAFAFPTVHKLAEHLKKVGNSKKLYNQMFAWRKTGFRLQKHVLRDPWDCQLCAMLHNSSLPRKVYWDIHKWWVLQSNCRKWRAQR